MKICSYASAESGGKRPRKRKRKADADSDDQQEQQDDYQKNCVHLVARAFVPRCEEMHGDTQRECFDVVQAVSEPIRCGNFNILLFFYFIFNFSPTIGNPGRVENVIGIECFKWRPRTFYYRTQFRPKRHERTVQRVPEWLLCHRILIYFCRWIPWLECKCHN